MTLVSGSCHHDCPDTCVWDVTVQDGRAVRIRGNADHPTTQGQLCPKVNRLLDRVYHPDRLLTPLRRTGPKGSGAFERITWDEAIDVIAGRFEDLIEESGGESILQFSFDGTQGVIQKGVLADRFFDAIGASDIRRHLCGVTAWLGASDVTGQPFGIDPEDLRHARTILLWGTNTLLTNRHLWPFIEEAREAGATVVTLDPVRTMTARRSDVHIQLRPGSDIALVLAMVHVMETEGLLDHDRITEATTGWDELWSSAESMTPDRAAHVTGVDPDRIVWVARTYATVRPAAIRTLVGPEHRRNGREIMRAISMLPSLPGAWRDVGGGLARSTQIYFETALNYPSGRPPRRTFNMARLGEVLNDSSLEPPVRGLMVHNSNPAVIVPDQNAVIRGLEREDLFTVVAEQFLTDTARYADIVLPATTQIEHLDLGIAWGHLYLSLNRPAIDPVGEALPTTEVFRRLARAMGLDQPALHEDDETLIRDLLASDHPWTEGITFDSLSERTWQRLAIAPGHRPFGIGDRFQLGAVTPPDRRAPRPGMLELMSRKQHIKFLNANYGGMPEHYPRGGHPQVDLHPDDARDRGISDGDEVTVSNDRGSLTLVAAISSDVQPGMASIPFGWWNRHTPEGRSVNVLTDAITPEDDLGSAAFHDTWVDVERVTA